MSKKKDVLLSISLIVKNEEQNLARCLDSLKGLRESIPCQLIITDTGSVDRTIEIAKTYTDEVYDFEWCDDFAAARNFGLKKAVGKWFVYIDADEWFEDTEELIEFFKSGEYKDYNSASYIVKNYINSLDRSDYADSRLYRLYKMDKDTSFIGAIHEYIPIKNPSKAFSSFVHHYSYAGNNDGEYRKEKYIRNIKPLLKAFAINPEDIRTRFHLAQEYKAGNELVKYEELVDGTFEMLKGDIENPYYPYFLKFKTKVYKDTEPQKGIALLENYLKKIKETKIWDLDILVSLADLCHKSGNYEKAIQYCDQYLKLLEKHLNGEIKEDFSFSVASPLFVSREFGITVQNLKAKCYLILERVGEAANTMKTVDFEILPLSDIEETLKLLVYCAGKLQSWKMIPEKYLELLNNRQPDKRDAFVNVLEEFIQKDRSGAVFSIAQAFCQVKALEKFADDDYIQLQELRRCTVEKDKNALAVLRNFFSDKQGKTIDTIYAEFILQSILSEECIDTWLDMIDTEVIGSYLDKVFTIYADIEEAFYDAFNSTKFSFVEEPKILLFWKLCILERCLLNSRQKEEYFRKDLIRLYLAKGESYIQYIYSQEIFQEEQIKILPSSYRFIYFSAIAVRAIDKGEFGIAVEMLKKAVKNYPVLSIEVELLLDDIQKRQNEQENSRQSNELEFERHGEEIKKKIILIAENGMRDEAIKLLDAYTKINPNDKQEIAELKRRFDLDN